APLLVAATEVDVDGAQCGAVRVGRIAFSNRGRSKVDDASEKRAVLLGERTIETELDANARDVLRSRLRPRDHSRRIARQHVVDDERERYDGPDDEDRP